MGRAQGFARGDIDTAFPLDDKFLALRGQADPVTYYAASGVYFHVVAGTWREAERKPASRIAPDAPEIVALLVRVGLLDADECVPRRAFTHFLGRAVRARRAATDRKARNRTQMSRVTDRDTRDRHALSTDIQSGAERSGAVQSGTERSGKEKGGRKPRPPSPGQKVRTWFRENDIAQPVGWEASKVNELAKVNGPDAVIAAFEEARTTAGAVTARNYIRWAEQTLNPDPVSRNGKQTPKGFQPSREERDRAFVRD